MSANETRQKTSSKKSEKQRKTANMCEYKRNSVFLSHEKSPQKWTTVTIWAQKGELIFFKERDMLINKGFRDKP